MAISLTQFDSMLNLNGVVAGEQRYVMIKSDFQAAASIDDNGDHVGGLFETLQGGTVRFKAMGFELDGATEVVLVVADKAAFDLVITDGTTPVIANSYYPA